MKWVQRPYDIKKEAELIKRGENKLVARLLSQRNVNMDDERFFDSDYQKLSHPHSLNGVEKAVQLFIKAVSQKKRIGIMGDYDCDGILSSLMIKELCNSLDVECDVFLPSRLEHGYGLTMKSIKAFINKYKPLPDFLFVLDCGTNNPDEVAFLREQGIENIVIIDHHIASNKISSNADVLISWHMTEGYNEMCAAGEVYQFIRGIRWITKKINPIEYLTYAAVATIADVSPIMGDNRIIVKHGLKAEAINHIVSAGFMSLLEESRIPVYDLTQEDILFKIAPKINAAGRLQHPDIAFNLLVEHDKQLAEPMAEYLINFNEERKNLQKQIELEAIEIVQKQNPTHGIMVCNEKWHIGVVGIVASRLTEVFHQPAVVVGKHDGIWRGSGRTMSGINIKEILDGCPDLFVKYGGHADAVGVEVKSDKVSEAPAVFNEACKNFIEKNNISTEKNNYYDAKLSVSAASPKTALFLREKLYPYCEENNAQPIFMLPQVKIINLTVKDGKGWRLLTFQVEKDGKASKHPFKIFSSKFGTDLEGVTADVFFMFSQKSKNPELQVVDIVKNSL